MMTVERLNVKNSDQFYKLLEESNSISKYRMDFNSFYENNSFLLKYFIKKLVRVIKFDDEYIGYIWIELPSSQSQRIADMYIQESYLNYFNKNVLSILKSDMVLYESYESDLLLKTVKRLGMTRLKVTNLMKLFPEYNNIESRKTNATFKTIIKKEDDETRCKIQNLIFKEDSRTPLSVEDIVYDQKQDYYIDDLCVFILIRNKVIGYGQIIYNRGIHSVVNFGIIDGYKRQGYGRDLIEKLILMANEKNIDELYIRVENTNGAAKKLYSNVGFKEIGDFSTWIWAKDLVR